MSINFTHDPFYEMLENFAKTISRTPVTKTESNVSGDETLTEGTPANISGCFYRREDVYDPEKYGLLQNADAILLVKDTVTIVKDDKITYDSEDYRIDKVVTRRLGTIKFYKVAQCFKY
jgi:hypothetical protein